MKKSLALGILFVFAISLISAYGGWGYSSWSWNSPRDMLQNEWIVFSLVFLAVFAMVYLSLANFFTKKNKVRNPYTWMKGEFKEFKNKPAVVVLSAVIAFMVSASFAQQGLVEKWLGEFATGFLMVLVLIIIVILLVPFYKAIRENLGKIPGAIIFTGILWGVIKYFFNPDRIYDIGFYGSSYSSEIYNLYETISSVWVLVVAIIAVVLLDLVFGKKKNSRGRRHNNLGFGI